MSTMEPYTTREHSVSEPPSTDSGDTFFKTPNAPPGYHFEQEILPGLVGPDFLIPASVSKLFRRLFRRAPTHS
jgi:hypothetical protein